MRKFLLALILLMSTTLVHATYGGFDVLDIVAGMFGSDLQRKVNGN